MDIEIELEDVSDQDDISPYWEARACGEIGAAKSQGTAIDELFSFLSPHLVPSLIAGEMVTISIKQMPMPSAHPPADTEPQTPTSRSSQGMKAVEGWILGVDE
jgi:hypothetical protein